MNPNFEVDPKDFEVNPQTFEVDQEDSKSVPANGNAQSDESRPDRSKQEAVPSIHKVEAENFDAVRPWRRSFWKSPKLFLQFTKLSR